MEINNTNKSFKEKWENNPSLIFEHTLNENSEVFKWITTRNGFANSEELTKYLLNKKRVLDAGCGNGRVTALLQRYAPPTTNIVGIDLNADIVAYDNLKHLPNVTTQKADLLSDLSNLGTFDFIYCQEVLHHTNNPKQGFENLCKLLDKNGELAVYVYKIKAPIREFVDDFVRGKIAHMDYEAAMKVNQEITELSKRLTALNISIDVPEVAILGIEAGVYDIQRFIYHFFMKCFWNSEYSFEDNTVINYDWYHPQNCTRHTLPEVLGWFEENNLEVVFHNVDFYGITVRGRKV